jgi:predicted DNA-binding protein
MIVWPVEILQNKYSRWYEQIITNSQCRALPSTVYTEKHHVVPKSFGGNNSGSNLATLTAREHFICHWLLVKMSTGKNRAKMVYALRTMRAETKDQQRYSTKMTSRVYEYYKKEFIKYHIENIKGRPVTAQTRKKISDAQIGKVISEETRKKQSIAAKSKPTVTEETRKKLSTAGKGRKMSNEAIAKRVVKMKGRKVSAKTREKIKATLKQTLLAKGVVMVDSSLPKIKKSRKGIPLTESQKLKLCKPKSLNSRKNYSKAAKKREALRNKELIRGEHSPTSKLTELIVKNIKEDLLLQKRLVEISSKYNISISTISNIKREKSWWWVKIKQKE